MSIHGFVSTRYVGTCHVVHGEPRRECINDATHWIKIRTGRRNSASGRVLLCAIHALDYPRARRLDEVTT